MAQWERTCLPMQETQETGLPPLGREDPLEKQMATHSHVLVWRVPWTEEPGGLQSMGSQGDGHNFTTKQQYSILNWELSQLSFHFICTIAVQCVCFQLLLRLWETTWFVQDDAQADGKQDWYSHL